MRWSLTSSEASAVCQERELEEQSTQQVCPANNASNLRDIDRHREGEMERKKKREGKGGRERDTEGRSEGTKKVQYR